MKQRPFDRVSSDLLVGILSRLDTPSIACSRLVCKSWYDASTSEDFLEHHYKPPQDHSSVPWVLVTVRTFGRATTESLWRPFSGQETRPVSLTCPSDFLFLGTSNGLVWGRSGYEDVVDDVVVVGNPITDSWKCIPTPLNRAYVEMVLDPATGIYKVTAYDREYSSETEKWSQGEKKPHASVLHSEYWGEREVDLEDWPTCMCTEITRFSYKGKEYLATEMNKSDEYYRCDVMQVGVGVWEWDSQRERWCILSTTSAEDLLGLGWRYMRGNMYWRTHLMGDVLIFDGSYYPPLAFHMVEKEWECGLWEDDIRYCENLRWDVADAPAIMHCTYAFYPNLLAPSP